MTATRDQKSEASRREQGQKKHHNKEESREFDNIEAQDASMQTLALLKKAREAKQLELYANSKERGAARDGTSASSSKTKPIDNNLSLPIRNRGNGRLDSGSGKSRGYTQSHSGNGFENVPSLSSVLLVVDLNSKNPAAAFVAPSFGYTEPKFLPALKAMSKSREALLTSTKSICSNSQPPQTSDDWTKDFLSHCRSLLYSEIGAQIDDAILEFSFTARGDASDRGKAVLVQAVKAAGFPIHTEDAIQIVPSIEAVTIETIQSIIFQNYGRQSSDLGGSSKPGHNMLVLHYDGDVAEIQSYSAFREAITGKKSFETGLRLEELVYGDTVDLGTLVDRCFEEWMDEHFPSSIDPADTPKDGSLMEQFAELRRKYKPGRKDKYLISLARYQISQYRVSEVILPDSDIRGFFEVATNTLLDNLGEHYARIGNKKQSLAEVVFAGAVACGSTYVEDIFKDWGIGVGALSTGIQVRYMSVEVTPEMVVRGAVQGCYPSVVVIPRSRAHYGFQLSRHFEAGDPEWSRAEDPWDNIDKCEVRMSWQVQKDQLLDGHAMVTKDALNISRVDADLKTQVCLYRCELDVPPRWTRIHQDIADTNVQLVGSVDITFTEADLQDAEYKVCNDGVERRSLPFKLGVLCGHMSRTLSVTVTSADGRRLGRATFQY